jgi:hypothetical protein
MSNGNAKLNRYFDLIYRSKPLAPKDALVVVAGEFFLTEEQVESLVRAISEC